MMRRYIAFDIETAKRLPEEAGAGREAFACHRARIRATW
jgi:hypothetical protein